MTVGLFTSCEKNEGEALAIIGHSYMYYEDQSNWETIYFSLSGTVQISACNNGKSQTLSHMTSKIRGCNVEIYADYTDYWKTEAKGQLIGALVYYPEGDYLISHLGDVYHKVN